MAATSANHPPVDGELQVIATVPCLFPVRLFRMDLSRLTRPAILCQCSRCSSSLAALENEWAKLSNSYSLVTGWLSVDVHRIAISSEKKQIPQSSDMSLLRGRILQEISCKLCQQKLGVLCSLENGPNIFWKLAKVSFREIVTMRTVEPLFKEGALERLLNPSPRRDRTSIQPGALVPTGSDGEDTHDMSVTQQMQHQVHSIDHISTSVNNLHDTMHEMKHAFTALRLELNGPGRFSSDVGNPAGSDFDMIATVLKELKLKTEEIERLKLEVEALKFKNRYMEDHSTKSVSMAGIEVALPEIQTPGLISDSRKRPWPDSFPSGRTQPIAESYDDDSDVLDDFTIADAPIEPVKIPLKDAEPRRSIEDPSYEPSFAGSPDYHFETNRQRRQTPLPDTSTDSTRNSANTNSQQAVVKRPRVSHSIERPQTSGAPEKRKPGRPRKSINQAEKPDLSQTPKQMPLTEQAANVSGGSQKEQAAWNPSPSEPRNPSAIENRPRGRPARNPSRPPSRPPANSRKRTSDINGNYPEQGPASTTEMTRHEGTTHATEPSDMANLPGKENPPPAIHNENDLHEKRRARDHMARLAMQREEAMEMEEAR